METNSRRQDTKIRRHGSRHKSSALVKHSRSNASNHCESSPEEKLSPLVKEVGDRVAKLSSTTPISVTTSHNPNIQSTRVGNIISNVAQSLFWLAGSKGSNSIESPSDPSKEEKTEESVNDISEAESKSFDSVSESSSVNKSQNSFKSPDNSPDRIQVAPTDIKLQIESIPVILKPTLESDEVISLKDQLSLAKKGQSDTQIKLNLCENELTACKVKLKICDGKILLLTSQRHQHHQQEEQKQPKATVIVEQKAPIADSLTGLVYKQQELITLLSSDLNQARSELREEIKSRQELVSENGCLKGMVGFLSQGTKDNGRKSRTMKKLSDSIQQEIERLKKSSQLMAETVSQFGIGTAAALHEDMYLSPCQGTPSSPFG